MKICVLGAGVIGVTTAYMLGRRGHEVIVIDAGADVAGGASHANGAQLSYSYTDPFASPAALKKLPGYLMGTDPAIRFGLSLKPSYLSWGLSFLSHCGQSSFEKNRNDRAELAAASKDIFALIQSEIDSRSLQPTGKGKIVLADTAKSFEEMKKTGSLRGDQICLTASECLETEPALKSWTGQIYGGLYAPEDLSLNTLSYCNAVKEAAEKSFGAVFHFGQSVYSVNTTGPTSQSLQTDHDTFDCDKVIMCLGNDPSGLLKHIGITAKTYPMQGYSLTLKAAENAPNVSITDLKNKTVYANLGEHIRIAGFVDANQNSKRTIARQDQLLDMSRAAWPDIADYDGPVERWTGYRPMTPSGVPLIGESKRPGIYLNMGHGSLGYTFAAGSAMKIAQEIGHAQKNAA